MKGKLTVIFGQGNGKTASAMGLGIRALALGKQVIMVQFLKGSGEDYTILKYLEPEFKIFSFERSERVYMDLSPEEKLEAKNNIMNGFNYAKKVIDVGECDVLILDELLGVIDHNILSEEEVIELIGKCSEEMEIIITGRTLPERLAKEASEINEIVAKKYS